MRRRYVTVDVFTDRAFGGNPLAVVLDADGMTDARMQAVAREFGYSETTFVLPPADPAHTARVRIFTPTAELPFAGHPNVGTAFVLGQASHAERMLFEEAAGLVPLTLLREAGAVCGAELTAPRALEMGATLAAADVAACVGLQPEQIRADLHPPLVASVGLAFIIAEVASLAALAQARPDTAAFRRLLPCRGVHDILLHAADPTDTGRRHARMFAPLDGIEEDPATGSACCALAALLASLAPAGSGEMALTVRQGETMGRPSTLHLHATPGGATRVAGRCVAMMEGSFRLDGG